MTYIIRGLTKSTVTFNKINLIIRGDVGDESISRNVEITTPEQLREIECLVKAGYIEATANEIFDGYVDSEEVSVIPETNFPETNFISHKIEEKVEVKDTTENKVSEVITDEITKDEPTKDEVTKLKTKASKNKTVKKIKRALVTESEDGEPIVMTSDGSKVAKVHKTMSSDIEDSPSVAESLKAAEKLDNPDKEEEIVEPELSEQDKMGSDAVIAVGNNKFEKKAMKRSVINETEAIDKTSPFIDMNESDKAVKDFKKKEDEKIKSAFIEPPDDSDETSDAFIEI